MAAMKTKAMQKSLEGFLEKIPDAQKRADCEAIAAMMEAATKSKGKMWGSAIAGFGEYKMVYPNGRELDWMIMGFSPRKQNIAVYGLDIQCDLMADLGKHDTGKGCLYIKRLSDVSVPALKKMIAAAVKKKKAK